MGHRLFWKISATFEAVLRIAPYQDSCEAIFGMNNLTMLLTQLQHTALDAVERLQRRRKESEWALPDVRQITITVI